MMHATIVSLSALAGLLLTNSGPAPNPPAIPLTTTASATDTATFAGGCFWSMERPFDHVPGVQSVTVGYAGGTVRNPTYEQVSTGRTGHLESVQVVYDPSAVSYDKLLEVYWHNIDPVSTNGQFCDRGNEYRTAIFYHGASQRTAAEQSKTSVQAHFKKPVTTQVTEATTFWPAESYHQHFADNNPVQYGLYRQGCGRDGRLKEIWGSAAEPYVPAP